MVAVTASGGVWPQSEEPGLQFNSGRGHHQHRGPRGNQPTFSSIPLMKKKSLTNHTTHAGV